MRKLSNNSNSNSNTYLTTNKVEKALGTLICKSLYVVDFSVCD